MTVLPERYQPALGLYETQKAIGLIKNIFQVKLCAPWPSGSALPSTTTTSLWATAWWRI